MDLVSLPIEFDKKKIDCRYRLAIAAAKRARELYQGAQPKIATKAKKITTIAFEEIISNSIRILTGKEAVKAKEAARKLTYEDMMDEAKQKESLPEDLSELEKDLKVYLHGKEGKKNDKTIEEIFPEKGS
ncbi:MAG: DNA-directed RNA polymerase subunit omega [Candidatus Mariimomonas ferrooxydans]